MNNNQKLQERLSKSGVSNLGGMAFVAILDYFHCETANCKTHGFDKCTRWGDYIILSGVVKVENGHAICNTIYKRDPNNRRKVVEVVLCSYDYSSDIIRKDEIKSQS